MKAAAPQTGPVSVWMPPSSTIASASTERGIESVSGEIDPFEKAYSAWHQGGASTTQDASQATEGASANLAEVNRRLMRAERVLMLHDGLKNRPWYKHSRYAPGFYTGYGVKTLPGVREAIEQSRWAEADQQIVRLGAVLSSEAKAIDEASATLEPLMGGQ